MAQTRDLINRNYSVSDGKLLLGGAIGVDAIVHEFGTPVFVYDANILDRKWHLLRKILPSEFSISYSVKANPNRTILEHFLSKGCGLEIASGGEFVQALQSGCSADQIVFAGPGKSIAELELVLTKGIGEIHVESLVEIERVAQLSHRLGKKARVAVRVNPGGEALGGAMRMGGKSSPFGVDEEVLDAVMRKLISYDSLEFWGIHLFTGTQILDYATLLSQYRKGIDIARQVVDQTGRSVHTLDFGGGLGIPYFLHEEELDSASLQQGLSELMAEVQADTRLHNTRFMVEPGRYLVGEAGVYLTQITDIKVSRGKKYLVVDGGMHHHLAASGNFGQVIKKNFPVAIVNRLNEDTRETVDIVGPLCTPLDVIARDIQVSEAQIGDIVGVLQSGAYARTASPLHFLSHVTPPEVFIQDHSAKLIRRRGRYEDLTSDLL